MLILHFKLTEMPTEKSLKVKLPRCNPKRIHLQTMWTLALFLLTCRSVDVTLV